MASLIIVPFIAIKITRYKTPNFFRYGIIPLNILTIVLLFSDTIVAGTRSMPVGISRVR